MTTLPPKGSPKRGATRAPVGRPIKLQFDDSMDVIEGVCRNISIGGMFISFDDARPAGSLVRFELELEDDTAIRGLGEVVWMRARSEAGGPESGFGLKFRFLEQRDRQLIFKLVSQHIKERLSKPPPAASDAGSPEPPAPEPAAPEPPAPESPAPEPPAPELAAPEPPAPELSAPELAAPEPPSAPAQPAPRPPRDELLPALDDIQAPEMDAGDVEMSVGETPLYELGLRSDAASDPDPDDLSSTFETPSSPVEEARPWVEGPATTEGFSARPRRRLPWLPVAAVILAALAAAAYLFKDQLAARFGDPPAADGVAARPAAPTASPTAEQPDAVTPPVADEDDVPDTSPPPASPPAAAPPPPPPPTASRAGFTRLLDVSWTRIAGGLQVTLTTDGRIAEGRFRHFRLAGDTPREVVRLMGAEERFARSEIAVGGPGVRRIRIGYHRGNEIHVVLDLTDPSWKVTAVDNAGDRIVLTVADR